MIEIVLLLFICIIGIGGLYYLYHHYDEEDDLKKMVAIFIGLLVVISSVFLIFSANTRNIALLQGEENELTLKVLLGFTQSGGYSPYLTESWGGTGNDQDFDHDGIKNIFDTDADNDGVLDHLEHATRFNPYQPDIGIERLEVQWVSADELKVRVFSVQDISGLQATITILKDNIIYTEEAFQQMQVFTIGVDGDKQYKLEFKVDGIESEYANKVNNFMSYTVPSSVTGVFGQWYANIENEIQGIIRNSPLYQVNNEFSVIDNLFRNGIAGIPLFVWFLLISGVIVVLVVRRWRSKRGKPPLFSLGKRKKKQYQKGDIKIQLY